MSQEDVVRRVYEAAARHDTGTVLTLYDREIELDASGWLPDRREVYRGHDGLRRFFREWHDAWGDVEYDFERLIDAGEHVISVVNRHGRGRSSGAEVEWPLGLVWTLREGKVLRVVWFASAGEALEAVGLSE